MLDRALRLARLTAVGTRTHLLYMSRSRISLLFVIALPLVYSVVGIYLYRAGGHSAEEIRASVAAGLLGIWSSVLPESGLAIHRQRWLGTFELLVISPARMIMVLFPIALATAVTGIYAMATTILCSAAFFGVPLAPFTHPLFIISVLACVLAVAVMGVLMAAGFVLLRNPYALVSILEIPVWLLSGMMIPLSALPRWAVAVSWLLPSRWGAEAVSNSVTGGPVAFAIVAALVTGAVYFVAAIYVIAQVERRARALGTLVLA